MGGGKVLGVEDSVLTGGVEEEEGEEVLL